MFKKYYSRFLEANKGKLHMACHSHHYWPDCTREATLDYWDDTAKYVDEKWGHIFSNVIPKAQGLIAKNLNIARPSRIAFAPNTHELAFRLLSALDLRKEISILTTDSEYHSFERQIQRLSEWENIKVRKIPVLPIETFEERFLAEQENNYDLVFFSHVFFNSGLAVKGFKNIVNAFYQKCIVAVDGYHGFMAIPTDLSDIENKCFYIAGSYKYAQGGEGCCFMSCPDNNLRPMQTGWFAEMDNLENKTEGQNVTYSSTGFKFAGATMDFTAMYRLNATLGLFDLENISTSAIHKHIQKIQSKFLKELPEQGLVSKKSLLLNEADYHGHFFTFQIGDPAKTKELYIQLSKIGIQTDFRNDRLRFGFGMYHDENLDFSFLKNLN